MESSRKIHFPTIDLDEISEESDLLQVVKSILIRYDTFLLKNFAGKDKLETFLDQLEVSKPEKTNGFDSSFTGTHEIKQNSDIIIEQYIFNTDESLQFDRECDNIILRKVYNRLFKLTLFFANLCLKCLDKEVLLDQENYASRITRYYNDTSDDLEQLLPDSESFQYFLSHDFEPFTSAGILTIFPRATGIKCKPSTISTDDNRWVQIDEPDCMLIHTGSLMNLWSDGKYTTSPMMIDHHSNLTHLTMFPPLGTPVNNDTVGGVMLGQLLEEYPVVAKKYYKGEMALKELKKRIQFYKQLFISTETVLSLYSMAKIHHSAADVIDLLPLISNMMKKKIVEDSFLRMVTIWPQCYNLEMSSSGELRIRFNKVNPLAIFTDNRRREQFITKADEWLEQAEMEDSIPLDVEPFKLSKRILDHKDLDTSRKLEEEKEKIDVSYENTSLTKRRYISNTSEEVGFKEKKHTSQADILSKLRERERNSSKLLSQRQKQYQKFLHVKMKHVFEILHSIEGNKPYTMTVLSTLVVDSLRDGNNPIGTSEAQEILLKLQNLLPDEIIVNEVDGGLKVFKWNNLNRELFKKKIEDDLNNNE
ncbi:hypothetical protein Kpol_1012p2 [Vanderwaltozyma polyspora DSM 70294]|uniref:DNA replication factor Cdt1 C-terminal domain-containing protein n=1 Tax=Vanderwaltozyma polyspora (strain ATCC 22028 / DSM 70294 / BCRC 21397 / CBS 2163 / NBRC 10782 / NRRL Y-8283 / UCD 57-17) TaxID=436907 RepID=A7TS76_VANPO|nr:uncharacterized protein Kpol_1012p2 [Vanderwaltozyma polyspora DSM 70294]EDO14875.1 hypothetical protein Kpol_1012p2 [Vanderwaltozyma polyspora DSM 70294]